MADEQGEKIESSVWDNVAGRESVGDFLQDSVDNVKEEDGLGGGGTRVRPFAKNVHGENPLGGPTKPGYAGGEQSREVTTAHLRTEWGRMTRQEKQRYGGKFQNWEKTQS